MALFDETGADKIAFCKYFKIEAVVDLSPRDFPRAVSALEKKKASK